MKKDECVRESDMHIAYEYCTRLGCDRKTKMKTSDVSEKRNFRQDWLSTKFYVIDGALGVGVSIC